MHVRPVVLAALAALAVAMPQAGAAAKPQVTDVAADANGINAQGQSAPVPDKGTPTGPASYAAADIISVQWKSTVVKKKVTGYTITLTLGAAPAAGLTYRIESASPTCASLWSEYRVDPSGTAKTGLRCAEHQIAYANVPTAVVKGSTITWTVPLAVLGKPYKAGTPLDKLGAQTRGFIWFAGQTVPLPLLGNTSGLTVPQLDHATSDAVFKI